MKKKVLSCLLALSMSAALLVGCGSSSSDSKSSDDSKKTAVSYTHLTLPTKA